MAKDRAFLDTTVLANVLLKTGPLHDAAVKALEGYKETLLPVYAIKEWKRGQFSKYVYIYNELNRTRSFKETSLSLSKLFYGGRWQSTAWEAQAVAMLHLPPAPMSPNPPDEEMADRFRLAYKTLVIQSWDSRRSIATKTVGDLDCYLETGPREDATGRIDIRPRDCDKNLECCLAKRLRKDTQALIALRDSIPQSGKKEDSKRREALRKLAVHNGFFDRKDCRALGDAYFALSAPNDSDILTTNIDDHQPLAAALGKTAVSP